MTDEVTINYTFSVNGDNLHMSKSGNYKEILSEIPPMHGDYLATLALALDLVVQQDDKLLEVIELLGSPEDVKRVTDALNAIRTLILMDGMKEEMKKGMQKDNSNGG